MNPLPPASPRHPNRSLGNACSTFLSRFEYPRMFRPGESLSRARMSAWLNRSFSRAADARDSGCSDQDGSGQCGW